MIVVVFNSSDCRNEAGGFVHRGSMHVGRNTDILINNVDPQVQPCNGKRKVYNDMSTSCSVAMQCLRKPSRDCFARQCPFLFPTEELSACSRQPSHVAAVSVTCSSTVSRPIRPMSSSWRRRRSRHRRRGTMSDWSGLRLLLGGLTPRRCHR